MTPLPQPKGTGIHAGRRATTTSSKEEARAGDGALNVYWRHTLSRATGVVAPRGAGASGRVCSLQRPLLEVVFNSWLRKRLRCLRESSAELGQTASRQSCRTEACNGTPSSTSLLGSWITCV